MDLLDFEGQALYFDEPLAEGISELLQDAARKYADGVSELPLLQAYLRAPDSLAVLVSLYRFYYYQHRLEEAAIVAERALNVCAKELEFPDDWRLLQQDHLGAGALRSMGLVRFYLLTLKAAAYLNLRLGAKAQGVALLEKLVELDTSNRLGALDLLKVVQHYGSPTATASAKNTAESSMI